MGTKKVFLSLWFLLSYTSYCAALQIDDTAYLDIHTSTLNNVTKPVLSSDEASFKHLIKQFSAMQSENRHLLERVGRIESENRQLFERLNDGESENKELLERVAGLESDNRQLLERQYRLESASSLYKKEIQWLKTEVMIQREHTHSMETIIKNQQAEIDELKQIAHISDESSNVPFSTGSQDIMSNEDLQPPLVLQGNGVVVFFYLVEMLNISVALSESTHNTSWYYDKLDNLNVTLCLSLLFHLVCSLHLIGAIKKLMFCIIQCKLNICILNLH